MLVIMSSVLNMEFVQALNPLYAFPIVAVILCAFIVYAFGFKSPVQPPSFDGIEEAKKVSRKRKTKDTSKGKVVQNGKLNGSTSNKAQIFSSTKKKDAEKSAADKPAVEKINEKKITKKTKQPNEKKVVKEKKKETISHAHEDTGEDGWVQLISKKGRKSRKKDEIVTTESQTVIKPLKNSHIDKSGENTPSEELPIKADVLEKPVPKEKLPMKSDKDDAEVASVENDKDKVMLIEADSTIYDNSLEKAPLKGVLKNEKLDEETSNKSKKKKKKHAEIINAENDCIISPESPAVQVIPEIPCPQKAASNAPVLAETHEIITENVQENEPKELKSSNVVFDELAGLYPTEKEQKKKKKVRRDH